MMATGADELFLDSDCSTHESGCESNHPDLRSSEKKHVDCKYQTARSYNYSMDYSNKREIFAFCKVCIVDFSVSDGSVHQIKRHCHNVQ